MSSDVYIVLLFFLMDFIGCGGCRCGYRYVCGCGILGGWVVNVNFVCEEVDVNGF